MPVNNKITPPSFVMVDIYFLTLLEKNKNLSIKIPEIINGIAKPNEYNESNNILLLVFSSIAAKAKIEPRMGPIQGVQPNPKAAPTSNGKAKLWLYRPVKILISLFINLKLIIPINWSEKNIIINPATILKTFELDKKNFPINEAVDPNDIKTKEKPKVKKIVLIIIEFFFLSINFSNEVPQI